MLNRVSCGLYVPCLWAVCACVMGTVRDLHMLSDWPVFLFTKYTNQNFVSVHQCMRSLSQCTVSDYQLRFHQLNVPCSHTVVVLPWHDSTDSAVFVCDMSAVLG